MIVLLSPAKTLDYKTPLPVKPEKLEPTVPDYLESSADIVDTLQSYSPGELGGLMSISEELSQLNHDRFQRWRMDQPTADNDLRSAIFAFAGDVYEGLDAYSLKKSDLQFAQKHLRILSGLYGMLRPLDTMQPYRLEMGTRLKLGTNGKSFRNLYEFWGEQLAVDLSEQLEALGPGVRKADRLIVNLASQEYFKAVDKRPLRRKVITPVFKDRKGDDYKVVSFWAKKARGAMVRFIIDHRIKRVDNLKNFDVDGYSYRGDLSDEAQLVFTRG
ncbi:peroxide stress protein YaaA [Allohahella marinimesophila]|uniref:UPF0246 protein GCM10022278_11000 n=1 Tax=Allohahella marinimesophila TaxID=1054972 RepID=A0ABP7NTU1_9GAMM